jgi:hypothetical protein
VELHALAVGSHVAGEAGVTRVVGVAVDGAALPIVGRHSVRDFAVVEGECRSLDTSGVEAALSGVSEIVTAPVSRIDTIAVLIVSSDAKKLNLGLTR